MPDLQSVPESPPAPTAGEPPSRLQQFRADVQGVRESIAALEPATMGDTIGLAAWFKQQLEDNVLPLFDTLTTAIETDVVAYVAEMGEAVAGMAAGGGDTEQISAESAAIITEAMEAADKCIGYLKGLLNLADPKTRAKANAAIASFDTKSSAVEDLLDELLDEDGDPVDGQQPAPPSAEG